MKRRQFLGCVAAAGVAWGQWPWSVGFRRLYNLDYDAAAEAAEQMPGFRDNPEVLNHYAGVILYRTMFRADELDSAAALNVASYLRKPKVVMPDEERKKFDDAIRRARELSEAVLAKDPGNANALYEVGFGDVQKANLFFLVDKDWRPAMKISSEARKMHGEAYRKDPKLVDALLVPSVQDFIVGSLPLYIKAFSFMAGIRGDKNRGIEGMRQVATSGKRAQIDSQLLLSYAERRVDHPERALGLIRSLATRFPENHFYRMDLASTLAELKQPADARKEAAELEDKRYRWLKQAKLASFRKELEVLTKG